jgi:glycosyltransferase involved in cell wall biosynthesis
MSNVHNRLPSASLENELPLVTVVTVVFNGAQFLEETIKSVVSQTYPNIEYIIIDGGSTDGTLEIIRKYEYAIDYWVSEKDDGIYDAMNKGIRLASGQWINFMNAGDSLDFDVSILCAYNATNIPLVYGDAIVIDNKGKISYRSGRAVTKADFFDSMPICHQAIFYSKQFIAPYDTRYKIISDRVMTYALMKNELKPQYNNCIQVKYLEGGMSYSNYNKRAREEVSFLRETNRLTLISFIKIHFLIYVKAPLYNYVNNTACLRALYIKFKRCL